MVTDSNELLGQALGTCTLQRLIGRGGMGAVYLARQSRPRRTVAVKVLLPSIVLEQRPRNEFLARFRREADSIAALDHVNIMPVYEYGEQGDIAYLVMPYVTGGTLREVLEQRGTLSLEEVVPIIEQAAAALDTAHAQSIVHRDLKPGNILFHADGRVLLADFGLAKVIKDVTDQESSNGHLTSAGTIVGTPEYLSPEQGTGDTIDYRTDVYSLGVVLYQMLAGRVPFTGTSPVAVAIKHALEQPPRLTQFNPSVPKNVEAVVMKAIAKKPDQRYDSAGEFGLALRQAVAEELGEQFLRIDPTPSALPHTEHLTPRPEPVREQKEDTTGGNTKDETPTTEAKGISAHQPAPSENNEVPSMSTMLMQEEEQNKHAVENAPRLSERTKNRIPALPTVITDANEMTIADYPRATQPSGQQQPFVTTQNSGQERFGAQGYSASSGEQQQQVYLRQEMAQHPRVATLPPRPTKSRIAPMLGALAALVIVIGGIVAMFTLHNSPQSQTNVPAASATKTAISKTPAAQRQAGNNSGKASPLPTPMVSVGSMLYGTNYPANCDGKAKTWNNQGVQVTCNTDAVQLTNTGNNTSAGSFTGVPSIGTSYYMQVQVTAASGKFSMFFYKEAQSTYQLTFDPQANTWTSYFVDQQGQHQLSTVPLITPLQGTTTLGIMVTGVNFVFYENGSQTGTAHTGFSTPKAGDGVGIGVDPASTTSFKNFAVYNAS